MSHARRSCRQAAFTIIELIIVVAIIAILLAIIFPTAGRARAMARRVSCTSQMRQLAGAWVSFSAENRGALVSGSTTTGAWVEAGTDEGAIRRGKLFKFVNDVNVYRCPADPHRSNLRTYSINWALNAEMSPKWTHMRDIKHPARTMVMIEEWDPRGYNVNSFAVPPTGNSWIDFPAIWHDNGANLSFADGHVEHWRWDETVTRGMEWFYANTPNNPDLKRIQAVIRPD